MFFQINVTPKEKKAARRATENEQESKQQEQYTLVLAPFQPQTRVKLDTTLYNSVQCRLNVKNPSNRNLHVTVSKMPPKERSVELTAMELSVEAETSADLGIVWTPQECGSWRDTLQLTDSRRVKYDVALMTTATGGKKAGAKGRSNILGLSNSNKTAGVGARRISPPAAREPRKTANIAGLGSSNVPNKRRRLNIQPDNKENVTKTGWTYETPNCKQTNAMRSSPVQDFSAIINSTRFNLTPINCNMRKDQKNPEIQITKPNEIEFSPQEIGILSPEIVDPPVLRRETYTAAKYCKVLTVHQEEVNEDDENFVDSLSPQPEAQGERELTKQIDCNLEAQPSDFSVLMNMNFLTPKIFGNTTRTANFSPNDCSTGNKTRSVTGNLSPTDISALMFTGNDTFNVSETNAANNSPANGTYELPASPTRSKDSIKPTRLSKSFGTMSPMNMSKSALTPSPSLCLEHLSMHCEYESTRTSICHTSRLSFHEDVSVKDVLEADLWVKPDVQQTAFSLSSLKGRCSSLEKIVEERNFNESRFHASLNRAKTLPVTREEKPPETRCIEISPPKKYSSGRKSVSMRRVSPTKSTKIRKDKKALEPASNLRKKIQMNCSIKRGQVSIPGVRIANLSFAGLRKNAKSKEKSTSIRSECKEVSVKLYDPNDFVTRLCNPDPFGATMTQDPFLTCTFYYDEKWMYHQETEFKKWLNALLTPPEHLDADVDTIRVDVGRVWQSCRTREDVALAETREAVSARYHTNTRLNTLRKAACAMFRREEVVTALSKATVCVERGTLMIRQDRDLHRDIGLQKEILELFLSYNPLWLRIGLETVYGETIPLHSNNDLVGLTRFLITRFFSDPFIVKAHSHANITSLKMPTFVLHMNKFILKKFLLIVFFLDYAKRNKLIGHDPCLFHKRATHKESRAILLTFSREVLSGVGDVTKVLRAHGYVVSHKQTYLDEYDYAVKDISTDLRDGVRLCRVMELITGDKNLTCRCRVPAISRLQKVHNVEVALNALLRCGYTLTGDIDAKSVADGHREKTLSLLWQIIYKYQAPRFDKAAKTVQKWWRSMLWYICVRNFLRKRKDNVASTIQRAWRCYRARKELKKLREERERLWTERERAVRVIQLRWIERDRMIKVRKRFILTREAIVTIQRWYRREKATAPLVDDFRRKRKAAITIQRHWRALILAKRERKRYLELVSASAKLQTWWRARRNGQEIYRRYQATKKATALVQSKWKAVLAMRIVRGSFQRKLHSARTIQSWWRRISALKRDRNTYLLKKHAVLSIESWWIGCRLVKIEKCIFEVKRKSVLTIQRTWRRYSQTKGDIMRFKQHKNACSIVQQWWRSARIAKRYNLERRSCVIIQRWWRGALLTKSEVASYASARNAVIVLQKAWRMKEARGQYLRKREAIAKIQSWYRDVRISRAVRRDYIERKEATLVIQRWWRNLKLTRERRLEYLRYIQIVIVVQTRWRGNNLAKKIRLNYLAKKEAARKIQASWKMIKERRNYNELLKRQRAATVLQIRWRETLNARKIRKTYIEYRLASIVIQSRYRALKVGRDTRSKYLKKQKATIVIQKNWRMLRALKAYRKLNRSAILLQSRWRNRKYCIETRARFLALKNATIGIQRFFRAKRIGLETREKYLKLCSTVRYVQERWRANMKMKKEKSEFIKYRKSTIVLQSNWRMISERRRYGLTRKAVSTIQSKWRALVNARKVRAVYAALRVSVIIVQRRFRANKACRIARNEYAYVRKKIIWIQNAWRKKLENRMREEAAISIQSWWMSILAMRECKRRYERRKAAVLVIQRGYRAYKIGVETRREYARVIRHIVRIQRRWRSLIEQKRHEKWLLDCAKAVSVIENWWLGILEMKRIKEAELAVLRRETTAATKIQTIWRGYRVRERQCAMMKELRERSRKAAQAAVPTATVAFLIQESMDTFLGCDMMGQLSMCLTTLDTLTRLSLKGCVAFCERNLVDKIYRTLNKSNRSLPWMDVCLSCTSILITLTKLPDTRNYVYRIEYIETLARLMTITVERRVDLFLHLATLFWLLAENPHYAQAITSCPRSTWLLSNLHNSINKKMSRLSVCNLNKSRGREQVAQLPNSKPDWGLRQKRPRLFTTVHHAITSLIKRLKIDTAA